MPSDRDQDNLASTWSDEILPTGKVLPHVSIVHPFDPWSLGIGGYDTCLDGFVRHAPPDWEIEIVGVTADPDKRPVGRWLTTRLRGRRIRFLAALHEPDTERIRRIPLSLRFALSCRWRGVTASGRIVQFHRFETGFALPHRPNQLYVYFLHNHPSELVGPASDVRWKGLPHVFWRALDNRLGGAHAVWATNPRTPSSLAARNIKLAGKTFWLPTWAEPATFYPGQWLDREQGRIRIRGKLELPAKTRIVVFAGRFESQKDPILLLEAFAKLIGRHADVALLMVGKGRLQDRIVDIARALALGDRFRLMGTLRRRELAELYRCCDVAVCTSAYEAGPRSIPEALACGIPVVSFNVGQVDTIMAPLHEMGLVVKVRGAAAFAESLERALILPRSREMMERFAETVRTWTPDKALSSVFENYDNWLQAPSLIRPHSSLSASPDRLARRAGQVDSSPDRS